MSLLDRAFVLNPLHPSWYHMPKAMFLMMTKSPQAAIAELEKSPMPDFLAFHFLLLWFYSEAADIDRAEVEKKRLLNVASDIEMFARRYFKIICLCDEIADQAVSAFRKVGLRIAD